MEKREQPINQKRMKKYFRLKMVHINTIEKIS